MLNRRRALSSWLAILAILLNALIPTVSVALENARDPLAARSSSWIEVCATQGSTWVLLAADGSLIEQIRQRPADAPTSLNGEHCPYCFTHAASFGLPPAPAWALPVWPLTASLLPHSAPLAQPLVAWLAPAARAPPAHA